MRKLFLIARSNMRKAKGQVVAIVVLILLAAMLLNLWLMLSMDYRANFDRYHKKLNAEHVTLAVDGSDEVQKFLSQTLDKDDEVSDFCLDNCMHMVGTFPYNGGMMNGEFIFLVFVSLYDSMVNDRKMLGPKNPLARLIWQMDARSVRYADRIIVDTKAHGDYFCREFGMKKEKMEVVYLNADTSIYYPRPQKKAPKFRGKFLVVYFGTVIPLQGFDTVLETVRQLTDRKNIHFCLIGPVEKRYEKVISDTVTYVDWVSQERLAELIAMADICLAGHFNGQIMKAKRTIPGKAYIYEAMEKPMILGDSPANHERYKEGQPGIYFVPMGSAEMLAKKIEDLAGVKENWNSH